MATFAGLPRSYIPFVFAWLLAPLLIMLAQGDAVHLTFGRLLPVALLLFGLARRSSLAWGLLLAWSLATSVLVAAALGPGITWGAPVFLIASIASVALLRSPSMRDHVGVGLSTRRPRDGVTTGF